MQNSIEKNVVKLVFDEFSPEFKNCPIEGKDSVQLLIFKKPYTTIDDNAFAHWSKLEEVIFECNTVELGGFAFWDCPNLKRVVFPEKVILKYRGFAFSDCPKLSDITLPKFPFEDSKLYAEYGGFIFHNTAWFHSYSNNFFVIDTTLIKAKTPKGTNPNIEIPETVTKISNGAFVNTGIKRVVFNKKVKEISAGCFRNCSKLKEVTLPNGLESIEDYMFKNCKNLEWVAIPSSVKQIKCNAFEDCGKVTIKAPKNSYAIAYAKECCIQYEEIGEACGAEIVTEFEDDVNCKQITFGSFVQDACEGAKKEPIIWDVIDETDDKMLILSHKCLASRNDYRKKRMSHWSKSEIRNWLNNQFLTRAFKPKERERILETKLVGSSSKDKVFLLNSEEFNRIDRNNQCARFSLLARKQYYEQNDCSDWNSLYAYWLLRPSQEFPTTFKFVTSEGYDQYIHPSEEWARGIRPAMWIKK